MGAGSDAGRQLTAIVASIIGLAIVAVILSQNAQTVGVIFAASRGLAGVLSSATAPVTGVGFAPFGGMGGGMGGGYGGGYGGAGGGLSLGTRNFQLGLGGGAIGGGLSALGRLGGGGGGGGGGAGYSGGGAYYGSPVP